VQINIYLRELPHQNGINIMLISRRYCWKTSFHCL